MGLFDKLFGAKEEHPPLDPASTAAKRIGKFKDSVESFASRVNDRMEVVPADDGIYIFVGKPPGTFGMAWFHNGAEHNLKTLMKDKGLAPDQVQLLAFKLGEAYKKYMSEPKFSAPVAGKNVVVHPSDGLRKDVVDIIHVLE